MCDPCCLPFRRRRQDDCATATTNQISLIATTCPPPRPPQSALEWIPQVQRAFPSLMVKHIYINILESKVKKMAALTQATPETDSMAALTNAMAKVDLTGLSEEQRKRFETTRDDPALNVKALLIKHRESIDAIKQACAKDLASPTVGGIVYDDLFIVRYILSVRARYFDPARDLAFALSYFAGRS